MIGREQILWSVTLLNYYLNITLLHDQKLQPGTKVLLRNSARDSKKGDKMKNKWLGPYTIHCDLNNGTFKLRNKDGVMKRAINGVRLKQFLSPVLYKLSPFQVTREHFQDLINGEWIHVEVRHTWIH